MRLGAPGERLMPGPLQEGRTKVEARGTNLARQVRRLKQQRRRYAGLVAVAMLGISAAGLLDLSHLHRPWRRLIEIAWGLALLYQLIVVMGWNPDRNLSDE
jgi:putative copper export protein